MPTSSLTGKLHDRLVLNRRATILAKHLTTLLPPGANVLDIGCGDGVIDHLTQQMRPDVRIEGIDVLVRPRRRIPVKLFDGSTIPHCDASFDVAMFIDVLHHTVNPLLLLREAARVAGVIIIKDHLREGFLAKATLRVMDWFGNAHHEVALTYNYWSDAEWRGAFCLLGVVPSKRINSLGLYPIPASWLFERNLHFMVKLDRANS